MKPEQMRTGARVVVLNLPLYRERRGTLVEVDPVDGEGAAGGVVALDDGSHVHRWSWEMELHASQLSPRQRLVWEAMRLGARRVPGSPDHARRYAGGGIELTVAQWCDPDEDGLGPLWRAWVGGVEEQA